jgi:hypothetical protein
LVLLLAGALALAACGPKFTRQILHDTDEMSIVLRAEIRSGERVERNFRHPATLSSIRIAHILSRIDVRTAVDEDGGKRKPAIETSLLYALGDLVSEALAKAKSDQEIVVQARRKQKRLGIFHQEYLTTFVAYVGGDDLFYLHLNRVDWPVPKTENVDIKEPAVGREIMSFRVIGADAIEPVGPQAVAVEWRDPIFRKASNLRVGPTGQVMRRTILMEEPEEAPEDAPEALPPESIPSDPAALRALAELEEARTAGRITEAQYRKQRRAILQGATP